MDFLDEKKRSRHDALLYVGYALIAMCIVIATLVLFYLSYGYGVNDRGKVIQNGTVYVSSKPTKATVYINGVKGNATNTKFSIPEGIYSISLNKSGYRTWNRKIEVDGGTVSSYTYPFLIPTNLVSNSIKLYPSQPVFSTESPDQHWLVVATSNDGSSFDLYDLSDLTKLPVAISLPEGISTKSTTSESLSNVAWADDNSHLLLNHQYDGKTEFLMLNTNDSTQSFNLTKQLSSHSFTSVSLINNKFDKYYLYDQVSQSLVAVNLSNPTVSTLTIPGVISYSSYSDNNIVYATKVGAASGKVDMDMMVGSKNYVIKSFNDNSTYLEAMNVFKNVPYVVVGSSSANKVYVFNDPVAQLSQDPTQKPVPTQVLFVKNPSHVSFSKTKQFIAAEGGQQFGIYDLENTHGYNYTSNYPLDAPQTYASWMDNDRLTFVSSGKIIMFDYDNNYVQQLVSASPNFSPAFTANYKNLISLNNDINNQDILRSTLIQ